MSETRTSDGLALPYRNPGLPVAERVDDLLNRMTPEEKIGQLSQIMGRFVWRKTDSGFDMTETGCAVLPRHRRALWRVAFRPLDGRDPGR
jgi:beta-glucosidase